MAGQNITAEAFAVTYYINTRRETVQVYGHGATYLLRKVNAKRTAEKWFEINYPEAWRTEILVEGAGSYMYA